MTKDNKPSISEPVQMKDGGGYYVNVMWPNGHTEQVGTFSNFAAAEEWMENESAGWLAKHPLSKSVQEP